MKRAWLCALLLSGCAATTLRPAPTGAATVVCAVRPLAYSLDEEHALRAEFDALPDGSELKRWIADYIAERASLRACAGGARP